MARRKKQSTVSHWGIGVATIGAGKIVSVGCGRGPAGTQVTDEIMQDCVFLRTGAWWDPDFDEPEMCDRHGKPNVLTHDLRTSSLGQSSASHSAMIQLAKLDKPAPAVQAHGRPPFVTRDTAKENS